MTSPAERMMNCSPLSFGSSSLWSGNHGQSGRDSLLLARWQRTPDFPRTSRNCTATRIDSQDV